MSDLFIPPAESELFNQLIHNPRGGETEGMSERTGWHFGSGVPEFRQYQDQLLVPDGHLLDIGIGRGRSSLFFALGDMCVTGVDTNALHFDAIKEMAGSMMLPIALRRGDVRNLKLPDNFFDTVLLDETLAHQDSLEDGLEVLERGYELVKPGGHVWVRANGIMDTGYFELLWQAGTFEYSAFGYGSSQIKVIEEGLVEHPCGCSGVQQLDRSLFVGQTVVLQTFAEMGANIVMSRCIPQQGRKNIMFGEDFRRDLEVHPTDISGTVTLIAQKPLANAA